MQYRNTTAVLVTIKLAFYASTTGMDKGGRTCTGIRAQHGYSHGCTKSTAAGALELHVRAYIG